MQPFGLNHLMQRACQGLQSLRQSKKYAQGFYHVRIRLLQSEQDVLKPGASFFPEWHE
jgi:hypothetical protein